MQVKKSLIGLPRKGKALIVTDINGNLADFENYMEIWRNFKSKENHLIFTGDYIHGHGDEDDSIEVLEKVIKLNDDEGVHLLLGNHEWGHISGEDIYNEGINQTVEFEMQLEEKFGSEWKNKLHLYINFFKKLHLAVRTENRVFISHAAPAKNIKGIKDIINITDNGYAIENENLFELLWNRYDKDYNEHDIDVFLKKVGCKVSVVGHTPVDGIKVIGNQVIIASSFGAEKKAYIELDLEKKITGVDDVLEMVKYI